MSEPTLLLAPGAMHPPLAASLVDFDATVGMQVALFTLLAVLLYPLLLKPMLRLIEERDARTKGAQAAAQEMRHRADVLEKTYERELAEVTRAAQAERDGLRLEAQRLEAKHIDEAREAAAVVLADGRAKAQAELDALRATLAARTDSLANTIAEQVLGREVRS